MAWQNEHKVCSRKYIGNNNFALRSQCGKGREANANKISPLAASPPQEWPPPPFLPIDSPGENTPVLRHKASFFFPPLLHLLVDGLTSSFSSFPNQCFPRTQKKKCLSRRGKQLCVLIAVRKKGNIYRICMCVCVFECIYIYITRMYNNKSTEFESREGGNDILSRKRTTKASPNFYDRWTEFFSQTQRLYLWNFLHIWSGDFKLSPS